MGGDLSAGPTLSPKPADGDAAGGDSLPASFRRTALTSYLNTAASLVVALVTVPLLARGLGPQEYGIWVLVGSLVLYLELLEFGFGTTTIRYVAAATARDDEDEVRDAIATSFWVLSVPGAAALAVGLALAAFFPALFDTRPDLIGPTRILLVLLAFDLALSIPSDVFGGVLIALQRFDLLNTTLIIVSLAQAAGIAIVLASGGGLVELGIVTVALSLLGQLSRYLLGRRLVPGLSLSPRRVRRDLLRPYASTSLWFSLNEVSTVVIARIDTVVVGIVLGVAQAGTYAIGQKLALLGNRLVMPALTSFFPHATVLAERGQRAALRQSAISAVRIAAAVALPPCAVLAVMSERAVNAWVGSGFGDAVLVVVFLAAASSFSVLRIPGQLMLNGAGRLKVPALLNVVEAACNLVLSVFLARAMGIKGVALATLLTSGVVTLLLFVPYFCREIGLTVRSLLGSIVGSHGLPLAVVVPLGLLVRDALPGALGGLGTALGLVGLYYGLLWLTGLTAQERAQVRRRFRRSGAPVSPAAAALAREDEAREGAGGGRGPVTVLVVDPSARGGIAAYSERFTEALQAAGVRAVLLCSQARPAVIGIDQRRLLPDQTWGRSARESRARFVRRRTSTFLAVRRQVLRQVRELQPDVVHLQAEVVRRLDPRLVRSLRAHCPVVITAHDVAPLTGEAPPLSWFRAAQAVVVHSEPAAGLLASQGIAAVVVEHVPAAEFPVSREQARVRLGLPPCDRVVAALGYVRPYKGYDLLLQVWRELGPAAPLLLVVGEPWGQEQVQLLVDLAATGRADVRSGYASEEDLRLAAAAADLVLLPHEHASDSGLLHLARAAGTPVLASTAPQLAAAVVATGAGLTLARDPRLWAAAVTGPLPPAPPAPPSLADCGRHHLAVYEALLGAQAAGSLGEPAPQLPGSRG